MFGRYFTSNPDLVFRVKTGVKLAKYERSTFYNVTNKKGYIDWPFSKEFQFAQSYDWEGSKRGLRCLFNAKSFVAFNAVSSYSVIVLFANFDAGCEKSIP